MTTYKMDKLIFSGDEILTHTPKKEQVRVLDFHNCQIKLNT